MTTDTDNLKANLRRWTLILGVIQITVGCVVGFIPPPAVAWFRAIVMAHIEFVINGVLMIVLGLLLSEVRLGRSALLAWFASLQIGTWANGGAGVVAAFIGASSKLMPTMTEKFPPPHGLDNPIVTAILLVCALTILVALLLTLVGLLRARLPDGRPSA